MRSFGFGGCRVGGAARVHLPGGGFPMTIERKLAEWRAAGLIDAATARRIADHESSHARPVALYAVGGVGAVAIVLGLVAIIASNWNEIPDALKLGVDLLVAVALAIALLRTSPGWLREILVIVDYGFVLASMSLVGQIYHLEPAPWRALLSWSIVTAPLMLLARGRFAAVVWAAGLVATHVFVELHGLEWLDDETRIGRRVLLNVALVSAGIAPAAYLLVARVAWLRRARPATSNVFRAVGWGGVALLVGVFATFFYAPLEAKETVAPGALLLLLAYAGMAAMLPRIEDVRAPRAILGMRALLVAGPILALVSAGFERGEAPVVAALLQLAVLAGIAWTALQAGHEGIFRLGVATVCLRLLGIYIEVFGSMLQTGLGLVIGGVLTIALAWFWVRKSRGLATALTDPHGAPAGDRGDLP